MLKVDSVSLTFQKQVLNSISFELKKGEVLGIVGKSGSGKTSLLKIVGGLLDATEGIVTFNKEKVKGPSQQLIPGHPEIQLVNQDFGLDIYHTVQENIALKILHLHQKEKNDLIEELLDLVELTELANRKAFELSGGEQQRLAIARALAMEPAILLLDEPFAHLDLRLKEKLTNYLLALKEVRSTAIIIVTHNGEEVLELSDEILYLNQGQIVRKASSQDFYYNPSNREEALFFGPINSIKERKREILFRPNQYGLRESKRFSREIQIEFSHVTFSGAFYKCFYKIKNKKDIILLYSVKPKTTLKKIYIQCED